MLAEASAGWLECVRDSKDTPTVFISWAQYTAEEIGLGQTLEAQLASVSAVLRQTGP